VDQPSLAQQHRLEQALAVDRVHHRLPHPLVWDPVVWMAI